MADSRESRTIIVTGSNSGLGYNTAVCLCKDGYDVILACRNESKGEKAAADVKKTVSKASVIFMKLDLSDFKSVREFVEEFGKLDKPLYALVNNAGMTMYFTDTNRVTTPEGLEVTMASNYYGHFLLTNLLLEALKKGAEKFGEARVVNISSGLHDPDAVKNMPGNKLKVIREIDFEDMEMAKEGVYCGIQAYKNSKAANIMFTYELARKLEGTGVTTVAMCPGFIPTTNLSREAGAVGKFFMQYILGPMAKLMGKKFVVSIQEGTERIQHCTTSEEMKGVSGKFYKDGKEAESKGDTLDVDKQKKLWCLTEEIVGFKSEGTKL